MIDMLAQGLGIIGFILVVLSFQSNKRHKVLLLLWIAQTIFAVHFGLISAWTAMAMNIIAAVRTFMFEFREVKAWAKFEFWPYVFAGLFLIVGTTLAWEDWHSLLPILAQVIETIALWSLVTKRMRWIILITKPMWFTYNLIVSSWGGMMTEVFVAASVLIAMYRFDIKRKNV